MHDPDLTPLLTRCSNDELEPLFCYLSNPVTSELKNKPRVKAYQPNHGKYVDEIVNELQLYGGNSVANFFRGHGVFYAEVLGDVCKKMGVDRQDYDNVEQLETKLLAMILAQSIERMTPAERAELQETFRAAGAKNVDLSAGIPASMLALRIGVYLTGFLKHRVAAIVANAVARAVLGRGLSFAANATLQRGIAVFTGPVGWVVMGLWTAFDLAGPAYRVTIPCCCHIAYLRQAKQESLSTGSAFQ